MKKFDVVKAQKNKGNYNPVYSMYFCSFVYYLSMSLLKFPVSRFCCEVSYIAKLETKKENRGPVCFLVSIGAMKLTFLHLNLTFV